MASGERLTREETLAAFDEHLRRTRGVCAGTRRNYARFAGAFLQAACPGGPVEVARTQGRDVAGPRTRARTGDSSCACSPASACGDGMSRLGKPTLWSGRRLVLLWFPLLSRY